MKVKILIAVIFLMALFFGCSKKEKVKKPKPKIPLVKIEELKPASITKSINLIGTVEAKVTANVLSPSDGYIEKLNVTENEFVKKNKQLAVIGSQERTSLVAQTKSKVEELKAQLATSLLPDITYPNKPLLRWSLKLRWIVVLIALALFFLGLIFLNKIGSEFLPKADDGLITIKVKMPTGSSMEETHKVISQIEKFVKEQPYIEKYSSLSGGKIWGLVTYEIANEGEVNLQLVKPSQRPKTTDEYVKWLTPYYASKSRTTKI